MIWWLFRERIAPTKRGRWVRFLPREREWSPIWVVYIVSRTARSRKPGSLGTTCQPSSSSGWIRLSSRVEPSLKWLAGTEADYTSHNQTYCTTALSLACRYGVAKFIAGSLFCGQEHTKEGPDDFCCDQGITFQKPGISLACSPVAAESS